MNILPKAKINNDAGTGNDLSPNYVLPLMRVFALGTCGPKGEAEPSLEGHTWL